MADQDPGGGGGTPPAYDATAAQQIRQDQCLLSTVLRTGGPTMKQVAAKGLDSDTTALHSAAAADYWDTTPLSTAYKTDNDATSKLMDSLSQRHLTWQAPLSGLAVPGGFKSDADFHWAPDPDFFQSVGVGPWLSQRFWTQEDSFYKEPSPPANDASAKAATDLGNARYPKPDNGNDPDFQQKYREWSAWYWDMAHTHALFADDTRMFLENGGFPRSAPESGTVEFRIAVEDLKSRFASCEYRNPVDPNSVLGQEVQTASDEWQAEVGAVAKQRDAIFAANAKASSALASGAQALSESLGQSWLADHLTRWQAYWLPGGAGAAGTGPITFQLKGGTTFCLDDQGASTASGSPVQAYNCNSTAAQQWRPSTENDVLNGSLVNGISHKCLAVDTSKTVASGSKVVQSTCSSSSMQHWQYVTTMGQTRLYNVGAKLCLDASATKGADTTVKTCTGGTSQLFVAQQNNSGTATGTDSLSYPTAAQFTQAKKALPAAQSAAKAQLTTAQKQLAIAQQAATDTTAAEQQAYSIADAAGSPRGRGLLSGQQEAQVTMASAAALKAVTGATQTAYDATTASAEDSKALQAKAQTQASASMAAFHLAAAQEADAQAKAAAAGAALQAKNAAAQNDKAQSALKTAQTAESTAKNAADVAHAKRLAAEAQQAKAATAKNEAAAHQTQAAQDRANAERYDKAANDALSAAQTAGATAATKRAAAEKADAAAADARRRAWDDQQAKSALGAKAEAADAHADAEESKDDAHDARAAADEADADAAAAGTAADQSSTAADAATQEAQAADAAATRAEAAARRAQSDADDAKAAKATADAAVLTSEAAVATAIKAASQASSDADAAKKDAADAKTDAENAQKNAIAAGADATQAQSGAATTAGFAYTTAQAATAASDAAQKVTDSANDAIQLGAPYVDNDSSAGLAVLTAQASKSIADQQQAMAQAKADQAQKAAQSAQALADAAGGDEKNAKVAAADAAAQAAKAQVSAQQAVVSAAQAQKAAAEAQASEARTVAYDAQATADAAAAQSAADAASSDAATARASANEAESDADAAQAAAGDAQAAAATAREVASQADKDADAAEAAAKDAEKQAESAQQAATKAMQEASAEDLSKGGATGVPRVFTTQKITPTKDPEPENECKLGLGNSGCDVTFLLTFDVTINFYMCDDAAAPADVDAAGCPDSDTVFLGSETHKGVTQEQKHHFSNWDIVSTVDSAVLKSLWDGLKGDFVNCSHGSVSGCAWAASWFVPDAWVADAVKAIKALNLALHTGVGVADAWKIVDGLKLSGGVVDAIHEEVEADAGALDACLVNSFPAGTQVLLAGGTHKAIDQVRTGDRLLTTDPATGRSQVAPVSATFAHSTRKLVTVTLAGGTTLTTTPSHRVWAGDRGWTLAGDLHPGDRMRTSDGAERAVTALHSADGFGRTVYDLTVAGTHTFYVRTAGAARADLLVHNCTDLVGDAEKLGDEMAHTVKDHVTISDEDAYVKSLAESTKQEKPVYTSVWKDLGTAQEVVDFAISQAVKKNPKYFTKWFADIGKGTASDTKTLTGFYGAKGSSLGKRFLRYGGEDSWKDAGNQYTVILKRLKGHDPGWYVYTAYPGA
ncbi:ricin-type beta-trefoil lectin domain protein [Streptomyces sp. NPDC047022]|uniref:ricin-type beta-trefoil lectin domain protein n=1 Tax=Streptomyces sp. NPDC047022 TaxID=3155737 RepID=UPI0033C2C7AC